MARINGASIPLNSLSYVIVDYNAGTPIVSIVASNTTDYRMSFVLGYVVNEGGILYINDVLILLVEELEGCLEWTLKFQEKPSKRAWWIDYISVGKKELQ
jgi:hypothetical protein